MARRLDLPSARHVRSVRAVSAKLTASEPCIDVGIDDSRFRKLVGYRHLWSTPQSIRWIAEEVNKEQAARKSVPSRDLKKGPLAPVAEIKRD